MAEIEKTKEQLEQERAVMMGFVENLMNPNRSRGHAEIAISAYIQELRDRIAELEAEGGKGRPRAKRGEAAEEAPNERA